MSGRIGLFGIEFFDGRRCGGESGRCGGGGKSGGGGGGGESRDDGGGGGGNESGDDGGGEMGGGGGGEMGGDDSGRMYVLFLIVTYSGGMIITFSHSQSHLIQSSIIVFIFKNNTKKKVSYKHARNQSIFWHDSLPFCCKIR